MTARRTLLAIASALVAASVASAAIIHVPGDQPTIQQGIDAAVNGDEVVVADGTWVGNNNKNLDFAGKAITVRSASGDPLTCIIDCEQEGRAFHFHSGETGAARVESITITGGDPPATPLEKRGGGVLIENSSPTFEQCRFVENELPSLYGAYGGGACVDGGAPVFIECDFIDNLAGLSDGQGGCGGGLCIFNATVALEQCVFDGNVADGAPYRGDHTLGMGQGGGVFMRGSANCSFSDCSFVSNSVGGDGRGAAIVVFESQTRAVLEGCSFEQNTGGQGNGLWVGGHGSTNNCVFHNQNSGITFFGDPGEEPLVIAGCRFEDLTSGTGAIKVHGGGAVIRDCAFRNCVMGYYSSWNDSGVYATNCLFTDCDCGFWTSSCPVVLVNSTFTRNEQGVRGGTGTTIANCVVWGNGDPANPTLEAQITGDVGSVTATCIQDEDPNDPIIPFGGAANHNIDDDPLFADLDGRLMPGSPCIDAADNGAVPPDVTTDLDGNPRFVDDPATPDTGIGTPPIVDMGAYEFQVASPCPADVNGDAVVDVLDLLLVLAAWGNTSGPEDINGDGIVNVLDLLEVLAAWGPCE
jgi:hypothetical protein